MIQDILPHRLRNEYHPDIQPQDNDRVLCFQEGKLLLREGQLPTVGSLGRLDYRYLFSVDDASYFLASSSNRLHLAGCAAAAPGAEPAQARNLRHSHRQASG